MMRSLLVVLGLCLFACRTDAPPPPPSVPRASPPPASVASAKASAGKPIVALPDKSSRIVAIRIAFGAGSADDPEGKEGLTKLLATAMAEGGAGNLTYAELTKRLYPLSASIGVDIDRDETVFETEVAKDGIDELYPLLRDVLLAPRLDEEAFRRLKERQTSELTDDLRSANDEELGKEALHSILYQGHPYAHPVEGTESGLKAIAQGDLRAHRSRVFCKDRVQIGLAGAYDQALAQRISEDMATLPACAGERAALPAQKPLLRTTVLILDKPGADATAISIGFTTGMTRAADDFPTAAFITSYLGMHRQSAGVLFQKLRQARGFNYGDYAYAEHFEQDGSSRYPRPNVVRGQQYVSIWIRPVKAKNAPFALRGAIFYWQKLLDQGISGPEITRFRAFLSRYLGLELQTDTRRLGYAMDDVAYGLTKPHVGRLQSALETLDAAKIKDVLVRRFKDQKLAIAIVAPNAAALKKTLIEGKRTPPSYDAPKPLAILEEDNAIENLDLKLEDSDVRVVPADQMFR